jgi:hypothetical protein
VYDGALTADPQVIPVTAYLPLLVEPVISNRLNRNKWAELSQGEGAAKKFTSKMIGNSADVLDVKNSWWGAERSTQARPAIVSNHGIPLPYYLVFALFSPVNTTACTTFPAFFVE